MDAEKEMCEACGAEVRRVAFPDGDAVMCECGMETGVPLELWEVHGGEAGGA